MDMLENYKKEYESKQKGFYQNNASTEDVLVQIMRKLSGGKIKDARQTQRFLYGVLAFAILLIVVLIVGFAPGSPPNPVEHMEQVKPLP